MSTEIETRAKEMGWSPKEEFRGDPEKWIDAETYVKRGEELMPILRANNKRMSEELNSVKSQLKETNEMLKASTEAIEALKEFNSDIAKKAVRKELAEMKEQLKEAKKEGDVDLEVELIEKIQEGTAALKEAEKKPEPAAKPNGKAKEEPEETDYTQNPEWKSWVTENSWFGKDRRRTALALGIADELKADPKTAHLQGRALLDKVTEEVETVMGGNVRQLPDKVEGGGRGGGGSDGKSFADLPSDAKAACERQAERLVGPGRAYKTIQDWRTEYTRKYFEE